MVKKCYVLEHEDHKALVDILTSLGDFIEDLPDSDEQILARNSVIFAKFILGAETDADKAKL